MQYEVFKSLFHKHLNGANWKINKAIAIENSHSNAKFENELKILETRMKEKPEFFNKQTWKVVLAGKAVNKKRSVKMLGKGNGLCRIYKTIVWNILTIVWKLWQKWYCQYIL